MVVEKVVAVLIGYVLGLFETGYIFGKLKTVVQMIAIPFVLIYPLIFPEFSKVFPLEVFLCYAAAIASLLSGVIYFIQAKDVVLDGATEGAKK